MSEVERGAMRAGHSDREKVVARLNQAFAEGRLEVGELDDRVGRAYAAKTLGELVPLTADLPAATGKPGATTPAPRTERAPARRFDVWAPAGGMLGILLVNIIIWGVISLATGDAIYFWPVWLLIPLGLSVVGGLQRGHR